MVAPETSTGIKSLNSPGMSRLERFNQLEEHRGVIPARRESCGQIKPQDSLLCVSKSAVQRKP